MTTELDVFNLPCFVINLDRRQDRWKRFSSQDAIRRFPNLERISAVDGQDLDVVHDDRISLNTRANISKKIRRSHYEINTPGACGASLSHIECWKMLLESKSEYALILEDDSLLKHVDMALLERFRHSVPKGCHVWLLGHFLRVQSSPWKPQSPWERVSEFTGAHAYVIHRKAAESFVKNAFPIETHIEFYMCNQAKQDNLVILRHTYLRIPQTMEETRLNDGDNATKDTSCPLCPVDTRPHKNWLVVHRVTTYQWLSALGAVLFVSYGLLRAKR